MKKMFVFVCFFAPVIVYAQQIKPSVINSGGRNLSSAAFTLNCSVGEISIKDFSTPTADVPSGFLQQAGASVLTPTGIIDTALLVHALTLPHKLSVQVFPNPATEQFTVLFDAKLTMRYSLVLTDMEGRIVFTKNDITMTDIDAVKIDISSLQPGGYMISLAVGADIETLRVIKL
jgi:hypothetical protein